MKNLDDLQRKIKKQRKFDPKVRQLLDIFLMVMRREASGESCAVRESVDNRAG